MTAPQPRRRRRPQPQPQLEPREGYLALGKILRAHGLRGELRVEPFTPGAPNLQRGKRVAIAGRDYRVVMARFDRQAWILELSGLADRNAAEALRGLLVEAPEGDVPRDDSDSYFFHELIGLRVVSDDGEALGVLAEIIDTGANDVWVARGPRGEVLFPARAEVVEEVDLAAGVVRVRLLEGLVEPPKTMS